HGPGLERRVEAILEDRGPRQQPDDSRTERHEHEETPPRHDRPLPGARDGYAARSRQQEHDEGPHQQYGGGKVHPQSGEEERPHSMRNVKLPSVTSASIERT